MSRFDVCIAVGQDELNKGSAEAYKALYPRVFTGSTTISQGLVVSYDVQQAPRFNFAVGMEPKALAATLISALPAEAALTPEEEAFFEFMAENTPTFSIDLEQVAFTFGSGDPASEAPNSLDVKNLRISCSIITQDNAPKFQVIDVTADKQSDPLGEAVQKVILARLKDMAQTLCEGLTVPPLALPGVALSPTLLAIEGQHLFALANVVGNGMPALPADVDWPSSGFFALLSPQALQAVTAYAVDQLGPITYSDKKYGKLGSSAQFTLTAKLARPSIALKGTDVAITFVPNTSINASANWGITIGIGYDIKITPNPTATASIYAQERSIHINCNRVSDFKVELKPTGNVSQKFLSWAVEYIATRASNELGPMLVQYMTQFAYKVFPIPTLTQQIDSTVVTLTPTISAVENVQGNLGFLGSFDIS